MDLPRIFTVNESSHRIHNPFTEAKLATLGRALHLAQRRWLDENPEDELAPAVRESLDTEPARYARSTREHLGWGVFALIGR